MLGTVQTEGALTTRAHAGADAATPHLQNRAIGSTSHHFSHGATARMPDVQPAAQQQQHMQQHTGQGNSMQGHEPRAVPLQPWNGQSSNVWKPAWQQKAQQAGQERPPIADRGSGGSSGSGWKRAVRDLQPGQQQSQPQSNHNVVQSSDTTLADAFGGSGWGRNVMYTKTHR